MTDEASRIDASMDDLRAAVRSFVDELLRTQPYKWIAVRLGHTDPKEEQQ